MAKDERTSFGLHDLPSDAPSDGPENDDLESVTASEAEATTLQFSPPLKKYNSARPLVKPLIDSYKRGEMTKLRRKRKDVKHLGEWNSFVKREERNW